MADVRDLEAGLVLACVRRYFGFGTFDEVDSLARKGPDWMRALQFARLHGITPLLHAGLKLAPTVPVPGPAEAAIRAEFQRCSAGSFLYARELGRLHRTLKHSGIRAMAFKGPSLAIGAYEKLSLRECRDLDILVAASDLERAVHGLCSCGYRVVRGEALQDDEKHVQAFRQAAGFNVELHWAVSKPSFPSGIPFDLLWERRKYISILGEPVATADPEDLLLMLSVHGASHCWTSLKWICDIAALLRRCDELDWSRVFRSGRRLGCLRMVLIAITLARDVVGTLLPWAVECEIAANRAVQVHSSQTCGRLFTTAGCLIGIDRLISQIRSLERLRDRMRLAFGYLRPRLRPNQQDRLVLPLPSFLGFLYWPIRLGRLTVVYRHEIGQTFFAA